MCQTPRAGTGTEASSRHNRQLCISTYYKYVLGLGEYVLGLGEYVEYVPYVIRGHVTGSRSQVFVQKQQDF